MKNRGTKITVTEGMREFSEIINRVFYRSENFTLTKGGREVATIQPIHGQSHSTLKDLKTLLSSLPKLDDSETDSFAKDILEAKTKIPLPENSWDM
jgi:antitoxin (DNA-binding transcriptional repressor) of toxin-antitoxin stability system